MNMQELQVFKGLIFDVSDRLRIGKTCLLISEGVTAYFIKDEGNADNMFLFYGTLGLWNEALRRLMSVYDKHKKSNSLYSIVQKAEEYSDNAIDGDLLRLTLDEWNKHESSHLDAAKNLLKFRHTKFAHIDQKNLVKQLQQWTPHHLSVEDIKTLYDDGSKLTRGLSEAFFKKSKEAIVGTEYKGWDLDYKYVLNCIERIREIDKLERLGTTIQSPKKSNL